MHRKSVVFPPPDGPNTAASSPSFNPKETSRSTPCPLKDFLSPRTSRVGMPSGLKRLGVQIGAEAKQTTERDSLQDVHRPTHSRDSTRRGITRRDRTPESSGIPRTRYQLPRLRTGFAPLRTCPSHMGRPRSPTGPSRAPPSRFERRGRG